MFGSTRLGTETSSSATSLGPLGNTRKDDIHLVIRDHDRGLLQQQVETVVSDSRAARSVGNGVPLAYRQAVISPVEKLVAEGKYATSESHGPIVDSAELADWDLLLGEHGGPIRWATTVSRR